MSKTSALAFILASVALAPTGRAQTPALPETATPPPDAPATRDVPPPPVNETPFAPPALPPDLAARLDAAEQQGRIAARKVELLEEQLATRAKESPSTTADDKGFGVRSADSAYTLRFRGLIQVDTRWFIGDGALSDKADTFIIRRLRPGIDGTLFSLVDYRFIPDFASGTLAVFDAYTDVHPFTWLRLRTGKFKSPLGLERLQADADLPLMERALTQYLTPQRDVGAALWGDVAGGVLTYNAGIYNGSPDAANQDIDANHAKDFVLRALIQPFKLPALQDLGSLGLHFAWSRGNRFGTPANPQLPSFRSGGQNTFFSYLSSTTDQTGTVFAHLRQTRINPGLYYYVGPLGVLTEFVQSRQEVQKGNTTATLTHRAFHATASFVLGGKNGYDGATPTTRFDPAKGTWGALELAARWNYLKVDDATFGNATDATVPTFADAKKSARKAQGFAFALTFVPSRTFRLAVNYERTRFTDGSSVSVTDPTTMKATTQVANRNTENALFGRAQVNF